MLFIMGAIVLFAIVAALASSRSADAGSPSGSRAPLPRDFEQQSAPVFDAAPSQSRTHFIDQQLHRKDAVHNRHKHYDL